MAATVRKSVVAKNYLGGISDRVQPSSSSKVLHYSSTSGSEKGSSLTKRDPVATREEGDKRSTKLSKRRRFLLSSVSSKEASRRLPIYSELKETKSKCEIQKIQDGQYKICDSSLAEKRFSCLPRSKGCIPPLTYPSIISTVPKICGPHEGRESENDFTEESNGSTRPLNSLISGSSVGAVPRKSSTIVDTPVMEQKSQSPRQESTDPIQHKSVFTLVAGPGSLFDRSFMELSRTEDNYNGCQLMGMGSPPGFSPSSGTVACTNQFQILEQQRIRSSMEGITTFQGSDQGIPCYNKDRQQSSCCIHKQTGRHKESKVVESNIKNYVLVREQSQVTKSTSSERNIKQDCRFSQQRDVESKRMVARSEDISDDNLTLGKSGTGSICQEKEHEMSEILCPIPGGLSLGSGCIHNQLDRYDDVCVSTNPITLKGIKKDSPGQSTSHIDCSNVAQTSMVHITSISGHIRTNNPSIDSGPVDPGPSVSSRTESSSPLSLEPEWGILKSKGFSDGLAETLLNSRKKVTRLIYQKAWRVFNDWCTNRSVSNRSLRSVLEFLQCGYKKGLSVSTLKVQVSALSVFLERRLANEDYIIRFFQALRRLRPCIKSRVPAWDLNTVLQGLCESPFEPLSQISDKFLTLKTVFLLAITTARRIGELQALSIKEPYLMVSEDRITLRPDATFLPKMVSSFHRNQEIYIPSFCENPSNDKEKKLHSLDLKEDMKCKVLKEGPVEIKLVAVLAKEEIYTNMLVGLPACCMLFWQLD
ncbi:uncharacterized protein [Hyperolius riggenbachi]|uniref:uncharacterized protein n=1 Tax=Hyperolius riggenbachi TaxID=752182 RepID=UPI0035A38A74